MRTELLWLGRGSLAAVLALPLMLMCAASAGASAIRPAGNAPPKYLFLHEPPARWELPPTFFYNHASAPLGLDEGVVVAHLRGAISQWRAACGLDIVYGGATTSRVDAGHPAAAEMGRDGFNVVGWMSGWDPFASAEAGVFLPLSHEARRAIVEADVRLFFDSYTRWDDQALTYLLLHEVGHALGIGHSNVAGAVMSGQPHTAYTTQTSLQHDDVIACRALYATGGRTAVEYHHAGFDHYFITALTEEVAALDTGAIRGWARTGGAFPVVGFADPGAVPVCRFFSGGSFAPQSSHFYTLSRSECAAVMDLPAWQYEGDPFALRLPDTTGGCEPGTRALYRLYNGGRGGAPNHRYTTNLFARGEMIARGWIPEGVGAVGVVGCVPAD